MNYHIFHDHHLDKNGQVQPPLMSSMLSTESSNWLSNNNPIGLYFYQIADQVEEDGEAMLATHNRLRMTYNGKSIYTRLYSRSHTIKKPDAEGFKQMCHVFGLVWKKKSGNRKVECSDDEEVTLHDFATFLCYFRDKDMNDNDALDAFVKKYGMDRFFEVDHEVEWEHNIDRLSQVVCCLQPINKGSYDGQHRDKEFQFCSVGYYNAEAKVEEQLENRRITLQQYLRGNPNIDVDPDTPKSQLQLKVRQKVKVGVPLNCDTMEKGFALMRKYGNNITLGQSLNISPTPSSLVSNFLDTANRTLMKDITKWSFDNFWGAKYNEVLKNMNANADTISDAMTKYIENQSAQAMLKSSNCEWTKHASEQFKKAMHGFSPPGGCGEKREIKGVVQCMVTAGVILKYCTTSNTDYVEILQFLNGDADPAEQRPESGDFDTKLYRGLDFIHQTIMPCVVNVFVRLKSLLSCESFIVYHIRNTDGDKHIETILKGEQDGALDLDFDDCKAIKVQMTSLKGSLEVTDKSLGLGTKVSRFNQKSQFAMYHQLFMDIITTINKFGYNPPLEHNDWYDGPQCDKLANDNKHKNDLLRSYLL